MKKILMIMAAAFVFACSQQPDGYEIEVNLEGAQGFVLLEKRGEKDWIPVDTAMIKNGVAVLTGKVTVPEDHYLSIMGNPAKTIVFVENTKMQIEGQADSLERVTVTGSKTHDEYIAVNRQLQKIGEE